MRTSVIFSMLLATCSPREPEHFDKKILIVVKTDAPASSTVGSMIQPLLKFLIP